MGVSRAQPPTLVEEPERYTHVNAAGRARDGLTGLLVLAFYA